MDVVEFAEKFCRVELPEWQKKHLRLLYESGKDAKIHICMPKNSGRHQALIHITDTKELLLNGPKNDSE